MFIRNCYLCCLRLNSIKSPTNFISVNVRLFSKRNPYEVLGLKRTSSPKEVKAAYIKLCKELHPDMKPGDASLHKRFVELNDAYATLVNSTSRKLFDEASSQKHQDLYEDFKSSQYNYETKSNSMSKEENFNGTDFYKKYYYELKHKKFVGNRFSHIWILFSCFVLVIIGSVLYLSAYQFATKYKERTVDEKSRQISISYQDVRKNALQNSKEQQIDTLKRKWKVP